MAELGVILAPSDGYLELGQSPQGARRFAKHILSVGETFVHPRSGKPLTVDETWWTDLARNWNDKVVPIVGFPLANAKNEHDESPERNAGRVVGLRREGRKIIADIEVPDPDIAAKIGSTILGASAMLHLDYPDSGGRRRGKALCHVAATNRPHLTSLDDFRELEQVAATAEAGYVELPDGSSVPSQVLMLCQSAVDPVMLSPAEPDYQPEPDYGGMDVNDDYLRDEFARLSMAAMDESSGRATKPDYPLIVTDRDRETALSAEQQITDTDIIGATRELAEQHQVSFTAVSAMAHDAHIRSGLGHSVPERAAVLGQVVVALSRGLLEVDDEQVLALSANGGSGTWAARDEVLRLTAEPDLEEMFLAHPRPGSGRLVTTKTRAHGTDEDATDEDQPGKGGEVHAKIRAIIEANPDLFTDGKGRDPSAMAAWPAPGVKSLAQREAEEKRALAGGRPGKRSVGELHPSHAAGHRQSGSVRA